MHHCITFLCGKVKDRFGSRNKGDNQEVSSIESSCDLRIIRDILIYIYINIKN